MSLLVLGNKRGAALPIVLMVMLVLGLLGVSLWQYSMADTLQVSRDIKHMQAHYVARAGANMGFKVISDLFNSDNKPENIEDLSTELASRVIQGDIATGNFTVKFHDFDLDSNKIKITSEGVLKTDPSIKDLVVLTVFLSIFDHVIIDIERPAVWFGGNSHNALHKAFDNPLPDNGVILYSTNNQCLQYVQNQENTFLAYSIEFRAQEYSKNDTREYSFEVKESRSISLDAKYIIFKGIVSLEDKKDGNNMAIINLLSSSTERTFEGLALEEKGLDLRNDLDIGDSIPLETIRMNRFGVVVFEDDVIWKKGDNSEETIILPGYYLYNEAGVTLAQDVVHPNNVGEYYSNKLIKITNEEKIKDIFEDSRVISSEYNIDKIIWGRG